MTPTVPRNFRLVPLSAQVASWDTAILLPQDAGLVWAVMDIDKTLFGSLMTTLLEAPPVKLEVTTVGGSKEEYRLPPLMAHTGFQLSPLCRPRRILRASPCWIPLPKEARCANTAQSERRIPTFDSLSQELFDLVLPSRV